MPKHFLRRRKLDLSGRTVAITGGGGGLGAALSAALIARNANVALLDRDGAALATQASNLGGPTRAKGWVADVRDLSSLETAMADVAAHFGRLDVVVAAAGVLPPVVPLDQTAGEDWDRTIDVNLGGVWRTFKAATPFVAAQRGHLLAMSSMTAYIHMPLLPSYSASKAGVWATCNSLRLELRKLGVTVGSAHPIMFNTPLLTDALATPAAVAITRPFPERFQTIDIESVVSDLVWGIERRAAHVVTPRRLGMTALAPGLMQHAFERIVFTPQIVNHALTLADTAAQPET